MPSIDFDSAVIARSHQVPVVVDFWAPWCGPCRVLGPILEQLASAAGDRWEMVKVNTDEQPEVAARYAVMSIPAVKMFHEGRVVGEFVGALSASDIERWLEDNLPDSRLSGLDAIVQRWASEGGEGIRDDLERFAREHPDANAGKLRLAQAIVAKEPARARELVRDAEVDADLVDLATDVSSLADLVEGVDSAPPALASRLERAREALGSHDLDEVLEQLIEAARIDKHFGDDLARRAAVAVFRLLGHEHELTRKHFQELSMAIHS